MIFKYDSIEKVHFIDLDATSLHDKIVTPQAEILRVVVGYVYTLYHKETALPPVLVNLGFPPNNLDEFYNDPDSGYRYLKEVDWSNGSNRGFRKSIEIARLEDFNPFHFEQQQIHTSITSPDASLLRVPTGLIYTFMSQGQPLPPIFVPFRNLHTLYEK